MKEKKHFKQEEGGGSGVTAQLYTKNEKENKKWEWWNMVSVIVLEVDHSNRHIKSRKKGGRRLKILK